MIDRYKIADEQGRFESGSNGTVLENKLGVIDPNEMNDAELYLLRSLYEVVFVDEFPDRQITVIDLKRWHYRWLGNIYGWAGEERSVNMAKDGFQFAAATQITRLLNVFERDCLARYTPCTVFDDEMLIQALAVTHVEFILVHPFREGNGRLGRLLADVMTSQAGRGLLDYRPWDMNRQAYYAAIQAGVDCDYEPMQDLMSAALHR